MSVSRDQRLRVFLVGTEFFRSYGGIQYINRLLVRTFREMGRHTPLDLEVFSFIDGPEHFPIGEQDQCPVRWHGARRSRGEIAWQLTKRLSSARPDLVLFTHLSLLPLAELVRTLAPGARVAALAHGTEAWRRLEGIAARVLPHVNAFVSPSAFTAQKLVEIQGILADRVTVIPHGLDPEWVEQCESVTAREQASSSRTGPLLLSVTRLSRADRQGKGIELVLQALPAVFERCPGSRYMVVGGGGDLPRMAELVRQLGLDARTEFTGARRDDALRRAYAEADVFVLPTQVEGFGVVFLEAMYHRLPVVAVRAAATPEVVEEGVTGVLVPAGDSEGLATALIALLSDGDRRRAMGEAGRRRVDRLYRFDHFAGRWERWLVTQVPEAVYAARQSSAFTLVRAAAGAR